MTEILRENIQVTETDTQGEPVAQSSSDLGRKYAAYLLKLGVCPEDAERQARYLTDPDALAHRAEIEKTINPYGPNIVPESSRIENWRAFTSAALTVKGADAVQEAAAALQISRPPTEPKPVRVESSSVGTQTVFPFRRSR